MFYRDKTGSWFFEESRSLTGEEIIMNITVRKYEEKDLPNLIRIWNEVVRHLYERLGFTQLGVIPKGFRMKDGHYEDICPYYHEL